MSSAPTARRLPLATLAVVAALSLSGCAYATADSLPTSDATPAVGAAFAADTVADAGQGESQAYLVAAPPRTPTASDQYDADDIEFAQAALEHFEVTAQLARLMQQQDRLDPALHEMADELLAQQGPRVADVRSLLERWGAPEAERDLRLDGKPAPLSNSEKNLLLLERQSDAMGFGPFWLIAVKAHQTEFLDVAKQAQRRTDSSEARRLAAGFIAQFDAVDQALADLGA